MARGREVAEAYIDVNGDLSSFRQDLEKGRPAVEDAAETLADDFVDEFQKRTDSELRKKWASILDAFHSGEKVDWERALGKFDSKSIDDARDKMRDFADEMREFGYIGDESFSELDDSIKNASNSIANHRDALARTKAEQEELRAATQRAKEAQDRYNNSLRGMIEAADLNQFNRQFKELASTLTRVDINKEFDVDWSKMAKASGSLDQFVRDMDRVLNAAEEMGRITSAENERIIRSVERHVAAEQKRQIELDKTAARTRVAKEEADRFSKSLTGMVMAANTQKLEDDFRKLSQAIATQDWSAMAKGHDNMQTLGARVTEVTKQMRDLGRVSEAEMNRIQTAFRRVQAEPEKFNINLSKMERGFRPIHFAIEKMQKSWARMDSTVRLVIGAIAAGAGPIATLGSGLAGTVTALASSLASAAGSVVPLAAAFAGIGVGIGLAVSAWDGMIARVPAIQTALNNISATWQAQATAFGIAWQDTLRVLLENFNTQLGQYDFGKPFGEAFAGITRAFNDVVMGPAFSAFMSSFTTDIPAAVQGFGTGFAGVMSSVMTLIAGAAPVARMLGEDFARWGTNLAAALEAGRESGQLTETFEQMRTSLLAVLDFAGSLGMALGTLFSIGATTGNGMLASLTGIVDKFTAWMNTDAGRQTMITWFQNADAIIRSLAPVVTGLGTALASLVTPASIAQFTNLMTLIGQFLPMLGEMLAVVSQLGIFNILFTALNMIGTALMPLMPLLGQLATLLGQTITGAITALAPLFNAIIVAIQPIIAAFLQVAQVVGPALVAGFQQISTAVAPVIAVLGELIGFIVGMLAPMLGPFIVGIIQNFVGLIQGISTVVMGVVNIVRGIFTGDWPMIWEGLKMVVSGAVQAVVNFVQLWFVGKLVGLVRSVMSGIVNFFRSGWTTMLNTGRSIITSIQTAVSNGFNAVRTFISTVINSMRQAFIAGWTAIRVAVTNAVNGIRAGITSGFQAAQSIVSAVINTIRSVISAGFNTARSLVTSAVNTIRSAISNAFNAAVSFVRGAMSNFAGAVSSGVSRVIGFISGLPGRISGILGGLGNLLVGAGRAIIDGLLGGLKAAWGGVTDFVGGIASWIRDNKGPLSYDRTLLTPAGNVIIEGLGRGLEERIPQIKRTLDKVTDTLSDGFTDFSRSKMYVQGKDAASGLADGLIANSGSVKSAMAGIGAHLQVGDPRLGNPRIDASRATRTEANTRAEGRSVLVEAGAVQITTPTKNPELVAHKVIDGFAEFSNMP